MSQIPAENDDDNRSVAASDFVQFDQPDEVANQQEAYQQQQEHGQQQFGSHQNSLDWAMNTGSASNNCNDLKELKWMMANLQDKNQMLRGSLANLQSKLENLELKAEIRALKDNAAQQANYQALEKKFAKQIEHLEAKNRKLEEKLSALELQNTENGTQNDSLKQKLKEAEQKGQMEKNKFEEIVYYANEQRMNNFRKEMNEIGKRAIDDNQLKLDYIWGQLMIKGKKLANLKANVWNGLKTKVSISEFGLKATGNGSYQYVFSMEGFAISGEKCRKDNFPFPGTIVFYYEVTNTTSYWLVSAGFSDGNEGSHTSSNSYAIHGTDANYDYWLSGKQHKFGHPAVATGSGDVFGSGILLNSKNEWAAFFTFNGKLLGKPTPINPLVNRLYPTVCIRNASVMANFGDNPGAKPFKFDIDKCPGLDFE